MHYQKGKDREQVFITSMEQWVSQDSWARIVDLFVDAMPVKTFGFRHTELNKEGNIPYDPADMFKLLLYGYRKRIRSAPQLAEACKVNMEVIWLMKGLRPSARKINYFRANNTEGIRKAHRYFVRLLKKWRLVDGDLMAVDSMKIRAQNSLKNNYNQKKLDRHIEYVDQKIEDYLDALDEVDDDSPKGKQEAQEIEDKLSKLEQRREGYTEIQKAIDESEDGQVSMTDPDARAVIRRRNIVEVGYNLHATVDAKHKMIVDVFANGVNDTHALSEAGRRAQEITGKQKIDMIADKGYNNGIEIARSERMGVRPFVSPRAKRLQTQEGFAKSDFHYDQKADMYRCPAGEELHTNGKIYHNNTKGKGKSSYRFKRYITDACATCTMREVCTQSVNGRVIDRPTHQAYVDRNDARVRKYPDVYQLRQELVEHPFGTMKRHWGMDYTYLRGSPKVVAEYTLATICYNLMRMVSVKGITWVEKRLKRHFLKAFAVLSAHRASRAQGHHATLWWMSVVFYAGFIKFIVRERVVA